MQCWCWTTAGNSSDPRQHGKAFWLGYVSGVIWYLGSSYWVFYVMHVYGRHWHCDLRDAAC